MAPDDPCLILTGECRNAGARKVGPPDGLQGENKTAVMLVLYIRQIRNQESIAEREIRSEGEGRGKGRNPHTKTSISKRKMRSPGASVL